MSKMGNLYGIENPEQSTQKGLSETCVPSNLDKQKLEHLSDNSNKFTGIKNNTVDHKKKLLKPIVDMKTENDSSIGTSDSKKYRQKKPEIKKRTQVII